MKDQDVIEKWIKIGPSVGDKVLSVRQPWASLIVCGFKPFENRSWSTSHRGPVWIHASKRISDFWTPDNISLLGLRPVDVDLLKTVSETVGAIIGCAWLDMVYPKDLLPREHTGNVHAAGPQCWHFTAADELEVPVPCKGKLQLFEYR